MEKPGKKTSRTLRIVVVVIIVIVASVGIFGALTYPRTLISVPMSLTTNFGVQTKEFDVPILHTMLQVKVSISSGILAWRARITSGNHTVWSYATLQTGQTTYQSSWIQVSSGNYNFTLETAAGALTAQISVTSKGGFW